MIKKLLIAVVLIGISVSAQAGFHGGGVTNAWNGNLVQSQLGDQPQYPFIDYARTQGAAETANGATVDWRQENTAGYPSTFTYTGSANCESAGTIPWNYTATAPYSLRTGTVQIQWTGCTYMHMVNGATILPGQYGQNACSGSCQACVEVDSTHLYGTNCWAQYNSASTSGTNQQNYVIESVGDGTTDPQLTDVNVFYTSDAVAEGLCIIGRQTGNITDLESCFSPQVITQYKQIGVLRFINVMGENNTNQQQTTFEENTPLTYYRWYGANPHPVFSELATNNVTNVSGAEYNLNFTGLTLTDRQNFQATSVSDIDTVNFTTNASTGGSGTSGSTYTCGGTPQTCTLGFASDPSTVVVGMLVDTASNTLNPTAVVSAVDHVGFTVTLGCSAGPHASAACHPMTTSTTVASGTVMYFSPMLEINSSGNYFPIASGSNGLLFGTVAVHGGHTAQYTYFQDLNRFAVNSSSSGNTGIYSGWPVEMMVALANAVGAHPYFNTPCFAMDNDTDWVQKELTFVKNNLLPGLLPFLEGSDEIWNNSSYNCYYTAGTEENYYEGGDTQNNHGNWQGWRMTQIAQTVSTIYGNPTAINRFKYYRVIDAFSAQDDNCEPTSANAFTNACQDQKLYYTGQGNDPAAKWVTDLAIAGYYSPLMGSTTNTTATANTYAVAYAYNAAPSTTLIHSFLDGVNTVSTNTTLYGVLNTTYPNYSSYLQAYVTDSTHGGPYPLRFIMYEGAGNIGNPAFNNTSDGTTAYGSVGQNRAITGITPGTTTVLNTGVDTGFDAMCNTYSLCGNSGPSYTGNPTTKLLNFTGVNCTLNTQDVTVISANSTSITVNYNSSSGNSGCTTGDATYDGSATYMPTFQVAATNDASFESCELANFDAFYADAIADGVTPEFPSVYNWDDLGRFGLGRYQGTIAAGNTLPTPGATIPAVAAFQLSQSGPTSCSP